MAECLSALVERFSSLKIIGLDMKFNLMSIACEAASIVCYILLILLFGGTWQIIIFKIIMLPLCVMSGLYLQYFKSLPHCSNIYYAVKSILNSLLATCVLCIFILNPSMSVIDILIITSMSLAICFTLSMIFQIDMMKK